VGFWCGGFAGLVVVPGTRVNLIAAEGFLRKADKGSLRRQTQQYLDSIRAASVCIQMKNT
jgi:hypothetical protein